MAEQNPAPTPTETKSGGSGKTILIIVGILLILCICCVVAIVGFVTLTLGAGLTAISQVATGTVCEITSSNVSTVYETQTTDSFKARVSEAEFEDMVSELQATCNELKGLDFISALTKGFNINYETVNGKENLLFSGNVGGKTIELRMATEDGELKIDDLKVN